MDLPWQRMDDSGFDLITIGDKTYPLASGYDNFVDTLSQYFPKEREGLRKYVEMLQDMIVAAANEAMRQIDEIAEKEMSGVTGGMGLPGGLF